MFKRFYGFLDGKWEDYLIPNRERRTEEVMIINLLYRKDRWIFLNFLSFQGQ